MLIYFFICGCFNDEIISAYFAQNSEVLKARQKEVNRSLLQSEYIKPSVFEKQ